MAIAYNPINPIISSISVCAVENQLCKKYIHVPIFQIDVELSKENIVMCLCRSLCVCVYCHLFNKTEITKFRLRH